MSTLREIDAEIARLQQARQAIFTEAVSALSEALPAFSPSRWEIEEVARQICENPGPVAAALAPLLAASEDSFDDRGWRVGGKG